MRGLRSLLGLIFLTLFSTISAAAARYAVTEIPAAESFPFEINQTGQVTGIARSDPAMPYQGFRYSQAGGLGTFDSIAGSVTAYGINDLGWIAGATTGPVNYPGVAIGNSMFAVANVQGLAYGINNSGRVVGEAFFNGVNLGQHAFSASGGTAQDLGTLGGNRSYARAINDPGQIVGWSETTDGATRAFLYNGGAMSDLGTLGGFSSQARDINNLGQIVGNATIPNQQSHAFLYAGGVMTDLGALTSGNGTSTANSLNNIGQVVGYSSFIGGLGGGVHGVLFENGSVIDLNTLVDAMAMTINEAYSINDAGLITARTCDNSGLCRGLLLTPVAPVPEPSTYALMLAGLGVVGFVARRRNRSESTAA